MSCLCDQCSALCCRYFVLEIDAPDDAEDYDNIRWYLIHENTFVFIEKKKWYLGIYSRCKHLQVDNRCGIYETRPQICRKYSTKNCDYHGGEYEWSILFSSGEQFEEYAQKQLAKQKSREEEARAKKRRRKARKPIFQSAMMAMAGIGPAGPNGAAVHLGKVNGNGNGKMNGNGNGKALLSLPVLRK